MGLTLNEKREARGKNLVVGTCKRCGHSILQFDINNDVATKNHHKIRLCRVLDSTYGRKKKWE